MIKFNELSGAIRLALLAGGITLAAAPAFAQDQEEETDETVLSTITVTGSRIQSQTVTASSPVLEIEREEFQFSGATRVEDLVNQYPQLTPSFDSQNNNPSLGYATVALRNLGAQRTLTLVNNRRLPPGTGTNEERDISIIPAALISRVDILTGGASAVYGSDAIAGVVNFVLDTEFEGLSVNAGYSAYQHNNDNSYMQGLQTARGFTFEEGDSGFDGASRSIDIALGSRFADGAGHAMAWITYRENDALFQGQRDYSSCALNAAGTACGGSGTNATGNFYFVQGNNGSQGSLNADGTWRAAYGAPYNYAPPNYFQRPDERITAGSSVKFEVNEYFKPYLETMFVNRKDSVQIAESGAFFTLLSGLPCNSPLLGTACRDLGFNAAQPVDVYVARRNIEGGPRITRTDDNTYRYVLGSEGAITDNWSYDASFLYARTTNNTVGSNDFLTSRIQNALLNCPPGSFAGCQFYNVWRPGQVTAAAANALAGTSFSNVATEMSVFNAYATGDTGIGLGWADGSTISLVAGGEYRREQYFFIADSNSAAGNFAGAGAAAPPVDGETKVTEAFLEAAVPVFAGDGVFKSFDLDLGYRLSDYDRSGNANTYKIGFTAEIGPVRPRGGYNRAIRAPGINDLFSQQRITLFGGADPCAGATPSFTAAQCANTGVTAAQYGRVPANPATQNNQFTGGNPNLTPEEADTWTLGFVITPIDNLQIAVDYYDIQIKDTITAIGAPTILEFCARTGDPFLCSRVNRNPGDGNIWRGNTGFVSNLTDNFGELSVKGVDLSANYAFEAFDGRFSTTFIGNFITEEETAPLPGVNDQATFDCAGVINPSCQTPEWRHIASLRYARDIFSVGLRWRYFGALDYVDNSGRPLTADTLAAADGGIDAQNYIDLSGSVTFFGNVDLTVGVNNVFDREPPIVGAALSLNGNAAGGYDQLGRFIFSSVTVKF